METNTVSSKAHPAVIVAPIEVVHPITRERTPMFVAHGPDGHTWLLKRLTAEAARQDGIAYFLATRAQDASGRWVLA